MSADGRFWLIGHEEALTGSNWDTCNFNQFRITDNFLVDKFWQNGVIFEFKNMIYAAIVNGLESMSTLYGTGVTGMLFSIECAIGQMWAYLFLQVHEFNKISELNCKLGVHIGELRHRKEYATLGNLVNFVLLKHSTIYRREVGVDKGISGYPPLDAVRLILLSPGSNGWHPKDGIFYSASSQNRYFCTLRGSTMSLTSTVSAPMARTHCKKKTNEKVPRASLLLTQPSQYPKWFNPKLACNYRVALPKQQHSGACPRVWGK